MLAHEKATRLIEEKIQQIAYPPSPINLFAPIKYTLSLGGKRLRPTLTLLACDLYGEAMEKALSPAIAIEVFHNFTLLHDDLMDDAETRRNHPTVHMSWDHNTAILSGDAMLIMAYQLLGETESKRFQELLSLFSQTALEICEGQSFDMEFETRMDVTEEEYLEMIRLKTAVLIGCSLKIGAIIGGASPEDAQRLYDFGVHLGIAFQLQDDLLDTYGDTLAFGKKIGGDILCDKKTFLLTQALKRASTAQRAIIEGYQQQRATVKSHPEEKIRAIKQIYDDLQIKMITEKRIKEYHTKAMEELAQLSLPETRLEEMIQFCENLMKRES